VTGRVNLGALGGDLNDEDTLTSYVNDILSLAYIKEVLLQAEAVHGHTTTDNVDQILAKLNEINQENTVISIYNPSLARVKN